MPAITSIGAVTALGPDWTTSWQNLLAGQYTISQPTDLSLAAPVVAPVSAIAGLERTDPSRPPASFLIEAAIAELGILPDASHRLWAATNHGEAELALATAEEDASSTALQDRRFGAAHATWIASACTGGLHALWFAWLEARFRPGPWLVAAGDALSSIGIAGFFAAGATGKGPAEPFRTGSGGMIVGEGAIAIELRNDAAADCAHVGAVAVSCDAGHPTHPDAEGRWLEQCIVEVLRIADCAPDDIAAVVAHGTGTEANDSAEGEVLCRLFGAEGPPVVSLKGALGHIMGAAGLLNVAAAAEIWRTGQLPPTLGSTFPRVPLRLSAVGDRVEPRRPVLALASGFGGNNVAAVIL